MDLYLSIDSPAITPQLQLSDKLLAVGSCFSDHMAHRLRKNKMACTSHPFGTLYHPFAVTKALTAQKKVQPSYDLTSHDGTYFHWDAHSRLWALDEQSLIEKYQQHVDEISKQINKTQWIIITLGSSYLYTLTSGDRDRLVANCHKQPQSQFKKTLSSVEEMHMSLHEMQEQLWASNPAIRFLYTVSPVRHTKDGLRENHVSKGRLLEVISRLSSDEKVSYFPSYEIIIDQLRDYRFYKSDGIHPNDLAIDLIWQKLSETWFSDGLNHFLKEWQPIRTGLEHKPLYPGSSAYIKFKASMIKKLENLSHQVDVTEEKAFFQS